METQLRNNSSGDKFSFPIIPIEEHNFEFNPVPTPGSPTSPADTIFSNGKLLPHCFPMQQTNYNPNSLSRSASRTSSVCSSSKDSLISSRSNSTNSSRSSSCSRARTSTSQTALHFSSDRKLYSFDKPKVVNNNNIGTPHGKDWQKAKSKPVLAQQQHYYYSPSQRWQFIAPAPVLNHQGSRARRSSSSRQSSVREQEMKSKSEAKDLTNARMCPGRKILLAFVSACKECHAVKPPSRKSVDEN